MIKVGIIGGAGYTAGELIRILLGHPDAEIVFVNSTSNAGNKLSAVHEGLMGETDMVFTDQLPLDTIDVLFFCTAHGDTRKFMEANTLPEGLKVIDLSMDYRLEAEDNPFIYGLPELNRRAICKSQYVANPGCFATAIQLALLPLARNLMLNSPITLHVAIGQSTLPPEGHTLDGMTAEQWALDQQQEVEYVLRQCQNSFCQPVSLSVTRLAERRTLAVAAQFKCGVAAEMIAQLYEQYYDDHNFVFIVNRPLVTADIENTNKCLIRLDKDESSGLLTIHAVMDVLLKGCAGNAVHAMNLMFGLHERVGLTLKGTGC